MLRAFLPLLLAVSLVPVATASIGSPTCQVDLTIWSESLHCGTTTTAFDSQETWCPPGSHCYYLQVLACDGTVLFPCTLL